MTSQRSYENAEVGQQLYAILEAVKKPEVLWDRLATGNYDWLGVRRNGRVERALCRGSSSTDAPPP